MEGPPGTQQSLFVDLGRSYSLSRPLACSTGPEANEHPCKYGLECLICHYFHHLFRHSSRSGW